MNILGGYCTSTDSSNGFLFAVKDKAIVDKATNEYFTVYQFGVSNDTSGLNLVNTQESITMNHDSARVGWEVKAGVTKSTRPDCGALDSSRAALILRTSSYGLLEVGE